MPAKKSPKGRSRLVLILVVSLAIAVALGAGTVFGLRWWRASEAAANRVTAFALFDEGRFEESLRPLSMVVSRDQDKTDAEAIRRLAKARLMVPLENGSHIPQAARFFAAAVAVDPSDVGSHKELLRLQMSMRQFTEAERTAEALLKLDPDEPTTTLMLAESLVARGDLPGAERLLAERVKSHPQDVEAKVRLWRVWIATQKPAADCLVEVDRWLAEPDADPAIRVIRAERLRVANRAAEAQAEFKQLTAIPPKSVASCRVVARTLQRLGRFEESTRILADGARRFGGDDGAVLARELFDYGTLTDDLDAAAQAVAIAATIPSAVWAGQAAVTVAFLRGDAEALEAAAAALRPSGSRAAAERDFAAALPLALAARKDPAVLPKANAALERALVSNPKDPILLYAQAELRMATGDRGAAIAAGSAAFEASGNAWVRVGLALVPAIEAYGDRARALAVLKSLAETQIGQPRVQTMLVLASADAVRRGEEPVIPEDEFLRLMRTLEREAESRPEVGSIAVLSMLTMERNDQASRLINRYVADPATTVALLLELARVVQRSSLGETAQGTALVETLLAKAEERGATPIDVANVRAAGGEAAQSLPALLALADAGNREALRSAALLADARRPDEAPAILERILREDATAEGVALVLNSQAALRDPALLEKAIAAAESLEGGRGDSTAVPRARLLIARGQATRAELDAALAELDEVRTRRGETTELLATMASLLLAADPPDITAAARLAGKAATMSPDRAPLQLLATALFRQAGNADSATLYLQKAMATTAAKQEPPVRRSIIEELRLSGQLKPAAAEARSLAGSTDASADWLLAADLSLLADEPAELESCLRAAVAASDAMPIAWARLAGGLARAGRLDEARKVLDELRSTREESAWRPIVVEFELTFGTRENARAELDAAIAKFPDDPSLMLNKARERINAGDPAAALALAQRAAAIESNRLVAREIALLLIGAPDPIGSDAIETLAAAGGVAADSLRQLRAMRDGQAAASATRALELARTVPGLWNVWAFALDVASLASDPVNRMLIAEEAVRALPNDPRALAACSSIMLEGGRPGEARDLAERLRIIAQAVPEYRGQATRLAALAQLGLGQPGRARDLLLASNGGKPDNEAVMLAAAIDAQLGNVAEAYRRAAPIVATSDPSLVFWLRLVGSLPPKDAAAALEAAASHEGRMPNLFASAWIIASGRDNAAGLNRAAQLLEKARAAGKAGLENAAVAFELAVARDDRAALEQARTTLVAELSEAGRELLAGKAPAATMTDPKDLQAVDSAATEARGLLERGRDLERAQKLLEAAIAGQGTLEQRVSLARVLAARGQAPAAVELATRLTRQYPTSPDAWLALARAKLALRDRDGALAAVEDGRKAVAAAFFVTPKVKAELETMAGAIAALSGGK